MLYYAVSISVIKSLDLAKQFLGCAKNSNMEEPLEIWIYAEIQSQWANILPWLGLIN